MELKTFFQLTARGVTGAYDGTRLLVGFVHLAVAIASVMVLGWLGDMTGEVWSNRVLTYLGYLVGLAAFYRGAYMLYFLAMNEGRGGKAALTAAMKSFNDRIGVVLGIPGLVILVVLIEALVVWGLAQIPQPVGTLLSWLVLLPLAAVNLVGLWFLLLGNWFIYPIAIETKAGIGGSLAGAAGLVRRATFPVFVYTIITLVFLYLVEVILAALLVAANLLPNLFKMNPIEMLLAMGSGHERMHGHGGAMFAFLGTLNPGMYLEQIAKGDVLQIAFGILFFLISTGVLALIGSFLVNILVGSGLAMYEAVKKDAK